MSGRPVFIDVGKKFEQGRVPSSRLFEVRAVASVKDLYELSSTDAISRITDHSRWKNLVVFTCDEKNRDAKIIEIGMVDLKS